MAFPVAKLGSLLMRQLSKPIANYAKEKAKTHPFFRKHVCMPPAQLYNWCEVKMRMWVLNLGKPVEIPKLNEAMAIELGANLLGETIIFSIAALLLYLEYARQVRKEAAKEAARIEELTNINTAIQDLALQTDRQDAQLRELMRQLINLESKVVHRPFAPPHSPPKGTPPPSMSSASDAATIVEPSASKNSATVKEVSPGPPYNLSSQGPIQTMVMVHNEGGYYQPDERYRGGTILDALDYITYRIPNGYTR